jgi:tetratricopeptide (TPR) repeat protein
MKVIFGFMLCTLFMTVGLSAQQTNETEILRNKIESLEQKLHEVDKDNTKILTTFENQDKRIEDIKDRIDDIGILENRIAIGIAIFGLVLAIILYLSVGSKAKNEARSAVDEWIQKDAKNKINNFMRKAKDDINNFVKQTIGDMEQIKQDTDDISKVSMLFNQAFTAYIEKRYEEALKIYQELIDRFKNSPNEKIQETVLSGMYNMGNILFEATKYKEAVIAYRKAIDEFNNKQYYTKTSDRLSFIIALTITNLGFALSKLKQFSEAIKIYQFFIPMFSKFTNKGIQNAIALSITNMLYFEFIMRKEPSFGKDYEEICMTFAEHLGIYELLKIAYDGLKSSQYNNIDNNYPQSEKLRLWKEKYKDIDYSKRDLSAAEEYINDWQEPQKSWVKECIDTFKEVAGKNNLQPKE